MTNDNSVTEDGPERGRGGEGQQEQGGEEAWSILRRSLMSHRMMASVVDHDHYPVLLPSSSASASSSSPTAPSSPTSSSSSSSSQSNNRTCRDVVVAAAMTSSSDYAVRTEFIIHVRTTTAEATSKKEATAAARIADNVHDHTCKERSNRKKGMVVVENNHQQQPESIVADDDAPDDHDDEDVVVVRRNDHHHVHENDNDDDAVLLVGGNAINDHCCFFEPFTIVKTYSSFRTLARRLKETCDRYYSNRREQHGDNDRSLDDDDCLKMARYCELMYYFVESSHPRRRLGKKVNHSYFKFLSKQRARIINDILNVTMSCYPNEENMEEEECALVGGSGQNERQQQQIQQQHPFIKDVIEILEEFFLTDHSRSDDDKGEDEEKNGRRQLESSSVPLPQQQQHQPVHNAMINWLQLGLGGVSNRQVITSKQRGRNRRAAEDSASLKRSVIVVPISRHQRRSYKQRQQDQDALERIATKQPTLLLLDDDGDKMDYSLPTLYAIDPIRRRVIKPSSSSATTTTFGRMMFNNNPIAFVGIIIVTVYVIRHAALIKVAIDLDVVLLIVFVSFYLGMSTTRPTPPLIATTTTTPTTGGISTEGTKIQPEIVNSRSEDIDDLDAVVTGKEGPRDRDAHHADVVSSSSLSSASSSCSSSSPMSMFPPGAELGTYKNCWSKPNSKDFYVRGDGYLKDHKKIQSIDYIFPCRGIDLFLTDTCPKNVGMNPGILGGKLRDIPTFIINFRLPWGVLIVCNEIPKQFIPYIKARYETNYNDVSTTKLEEMISMTPSERTLCRFLMNDDQYKNERLKLVPVVIQGPWVVRQVVGGKPAIIGNKLPTDYIYQPEEEEDFDDEDEYNNNDYVGNENETKTKDSKKPTSTKKKKKKELYLELDLDIAASPTARGILSVARRYTQVLTLNLGFVVQGNQHDELPEQMLTGVRLHGINPLTAPQLPSMMMAGQRLREENKEEEDYSG